MIESIFEMPQIIKIHLPQKFKNLLIPFYFNKHDMAKIFIEHLKDFKDLPALNSSDDPLALEPEFGVVEGVILIIYLVN